MVGLGAPGAWDSSDIQAFTPEWDGQLGLFRAWYVAGSSAGYLWSLDGLTWSRGPQNPVLTSVPGDSIQDSIDAYLDDGRYRIVYGQYDLGATPALRGKGEASLVAEDSEPHPPSPPAPSPPLPPLPPLPPHPPSPPHPLSPPTAVVDAVSSSGDDMAVERGLKRPRG